MKRIVDYINESKLTELKKFIDNVTDDNSEEVLALYDKLQRIANNGELGKKISAWLAEKAQNKKSNHPKNFANAVYSACDKYHCWEQIGKLADKQLAGDKDSFIKIEKEIDLDKIIKYYEDLEIPENFWKSVFKKESAGQPVMGAGEFLLMLITEAPKTEENKGDVIIDGEGVEVKNLTKSDAKLGNDRVGNTEAIFKFLNTVIIKEDLDIRDENIPDDTNEIPSVTISKNPRLDPQKNVQTKIKKLLNLISDKEQTDEYHERLSNYLADALKENYKKEKKLNNIEKYKPVINKTIDELTKLKDINSCEKFIRIFTILYTILYVSEENASKLCIVKRKDSDIKFIFYDLYNDIKTFDDLLNDDTFPYYQIRYDSTQKLINIKYV